MVVVVNIAAHDGEDLRRDLQGCQVSVDDVRCAVGSEVRKILAR